MKWITLAIWSCLLLAATCEEEAQEVCKSGLCVNRVDEKVLKELLQEVELIQTSLDLVLAKFRTDLEYLHESYALSAKNLLQYVELKHTNLSSIQDRLSQLGLSSLSRAESHVQFTLFNVQNLLREMIGSPPLPIPDETFVSHTQGRRLLEEHTEALLGASPEGRFARIMVTMPAEAGENYTLVRSLVEEGMNCMRINCAHDSPEIWGRMVANLKMANEELGKDCKVLMDLGGPKLRTGMVEQGPMVMKVSPHRDLFGTVTKAAKLWLTPDKQPEVAPSEGHVLPVTAKWLRKIQVGDKIKFEDERGKKREMYVKQQIGHSFWADLNQTAYITPGTSLYRKGIPTKGTVGPLPPVELPIVLKTGDTLLLTKDPSPGFPAVYTEDGHLQTPATISCSLPEIFSQVKPGEPIWFDDGKIGGVITTVSVDEILVTITSAEPGGSSLGSDKGINLPGSTLVLPSLTPDDLKDLDHVVKYADMIGLSFVDEPSDVELLQKELENRGAKNKSIILKIETRRGFEQLPRLLLQAMRGVPPVPIGVMIARGDLAVECGYTLLAELQEEILWVCEAAHVPVIWATQVLQTMTKKGTPTRAEITDAAMASRTECVMLNKGPYIVETVKLLSNVLERMDSFHQTQFRKSEMRASMKLSDLVFDIN